jgi:L-iditol 2-dehydrogenase
MRAAVYYSNQDIRIEERPVPKIGRGELLVRIEACGICGSDVMQWYRIDRVPLVLGHEIAGVIEEVGEGAGQYQRGMRVSASHHVPCGNCHYCLKNHSSVCETLRKTNFDPGGFAQFLRLPAINVEHGVYPLPGEVSFEEATFIEPLACVMRGQRIAGIEAGDTVLVLGSGISGLLHIQLAKLGGASRIFATDISENRLQAARRFGADPVIPASEYEPDYLRKNNSGRLADLVIICAPAASAVKQAMESVDRGGTVLFFSAADPGASVPLDINKLFWRNEITLTSSYAASPFEHREALDLIKQHKINVQEMITHRLGLAETGLGFKLTAGGGESIKVIIEPQK